MQTVYRAFGVRDTGEATLFDVIAWEGEFWLVLLWRDRLRPEGGRAPIRIAPLRRVPHQDRGEGATEYRFVLNSPIPSALFAPRIALALATEYEVREAPEMPGTADPSLN
jgi:hypothetical protein